MPAITQTANYYGIDKGAIRVKLTAAFITYAGAPLDVADADAYITLDGHLDSGSGNANTITPSRRRVTGSTSSQIMTLTDTVAALETYTLTIVDNNGKTEDLGLTNDCDIVHDILVPWKKGGFKLETQFAWAGYETGNSLETYNEGLCTSIGKPSINANAPTEPATRQIAITVNEYPDTVAAVP